MLQNGWQIVQEAYEKYATTGVTQLLLISSIIILLIREKKSQNQHLAYYIIILVFIIFLPPVAFVFANYFIGDDVYWRVFWLIPSVIVIAFTATKFIEQNGRKAKSRVGFVAIVLLIIIGGKCSYNTENFTKSTNQYKLPQEAVDICEMVVQEDTTKIVVPETIVSYIRQYNSKIDLLYGRNLGKDTKRGKNYQFLLQLNSTDPDIQYVAEYAREKECEYVVFANTSNGIDFMEDYGYERFGGTENYTVFRNIE